MKILVTGGASGIGKATTVKLLDRGHQVTVLDSDEEALEKVDSGVDKANIDTRDRDELQTFFWRNDFDVVVNCAGFYEMGSIEDMDEEAIDRTIDTNLKGTINVLKYSMEGLRKNKGRIVIVTSIIGRISAPYYGVYSASKHGLEGLADSLRMEMKKHDVDVTVVEPGPVETGFNQRARDALSKYLPDSFYGEDYRKILEEDGLKGVKPEKTARTVLAAVEERKVERRYPDTPRTWLMLLLWEVLPWAVKDRIMRKMFTADP